MSTDSPTGATATSPDGFERRGGRRRRRLVALVIVIVVVLVAAAVALAVSFRQPALLAG